MLASGEVAERLGVSRRTVHRWATLGLIPAYRFGRSFKFDGTEIEEWLVSKRYTPCPLTQISQGAASTRAPDRRTTTSSIPARSQEDLSAQAPGRPRKPQPGRTLHVAYTDLVSRAGKRQSSTSSSRELEI